MDQLILDFINKYFNNIEQFESDLGTKYIVGHIFGDRYMISQKDLYIVTKRIDGHDLYVAVYENCHQVIELLNKIKDKENLIPNDKAKMLASITGFKTI